MFLIVNLIINMNKNWVYVEKCKKVIYIINKKYPEWYNFNNTNSNYERKVIFQKINERYINNWTKIYWSLDFIIKILNNMKREIGANKRKIF